MTRRRTWLLGAAAVGVTAAAGGIATRLLRPTAFRDANTGAANPDIWAMRFAAPDGSELSMQRFKGKPLLLNFWATWCPPCVGELPLLDRFHRDQGAAWQVVGLAVDNREPVHGFLARRPVGFPVGLAGSEGIALSRALGNAGGALPFTVVYDRLGALADRRLGVVNTQQLVAWATRLGDTR